MRTAVLLALLVGCAADASKQIEKLADRACACGSAHDAACADKVLDDFVAMAKANPTMTGDQDKAVAQSKRLAECAIQAGMPASALMDKMKTVQAQ